MPSQNDPYGPKYVKPACTALGGTHVKKIINTGIPFLYRLIPEKKRFFF
jgi:hypothetical protein